MTSSDELREALRRHCITRHVKYSPAPGAMPYRWCHECADCWYDSDPEHHHPDCLAAMPAPVAPKQQAKQWKRLCLACKYIWIDDAWGKPCPQCGVQCGVAGDAPQAIERLTDGRGMPCALGTCPAPSECGTVCNGYPSSVQPLERRREIRRASDRPVFCLAHRRMVPCDKCEAGQT